MGTLLCTAMGRASLLGARDLESCWGAEKDGVVMTQSSKAVRNAQSVESMLLVDKLSVSMAY